MKKIKLAVLLIAFASVCISCKKEDNLTIKGDTPVIVDFTPTSGEPGTIVTITGKNFKENITESLITIAQTQVEIISASSTQLTIKVPAGASSGKIKLVSDNITVTSDKDFAVLNSPVSPPSPVISSFAPAEGRAGATVVISGANFSSVPAENIVTIGDLTASVTKASSTELTITVPAGVVSGKISVKVHDLTVTSGNFFVAIPSPVIDTFSPTKGLIGSSVSIYGVRFSTKPGGNTVKFNDIEAVITEATSTKITVKVPVGAKTGKISLTVEGILISTASDFNVLFPPVITSFTPLQGSPGTSVTIIGENFNSLSATTAVLFHNNIPVTVISTTDTKIIVTVPSGASTGKITVVANLLTKTSTQDFQIIPPAISDFTPVKAAPGASVIINGSNFSTISASDNHVKFNGTAATVTAFSETQLTVTVPSGATTGKISVEVAGNTISTLTDFTVE